MAGIDDAWERIGVLVKAFQSNESRYKSANYSEAEARKDFIDKFWIALGWDVNHDQQTNPYEQEVKVERGVATGASQRRADYAFYLAPNFHDVRFFVEAKKPFVEIGTKENYFQLIRYGWNSETPLAVLTDFEQFHVLDCRYKPDLETALNRCLAKYHYADYTDREKFAEIYWLFSREAVAERSLEKRAGELPKPRGKARQRGFLGGGYQGIDESFLAELDEYRKSLAQNFKRHNPKLDSETLTELAQRTLDRLVFLRFLEDKGIEARRLVDAFGESGTAWGDFIAASRRLDRIYNGIVYKQHDILDSDKFRVDEGGFANICKSLGHTNSPYDFNAIPIHILGSIYERFLGKVIVATDHRAKVVEKPEVRKAGGVYYTPEYIVRYIVDNTVGKLIAGKTPDQIAEMRFADIASGSGSFLMAVYDLLLSYHGRYYNQNPDKARKGNCIERDGKLHLSLAKRRQILLSNIYGVDIDAQAVEVCQLSLYLKLLQDETEASARQYVLDFEHTARMKKLLPDLSKNIVCGNSLIGTDYSVLPDDLLRVHAFNWQAQFPDVTSAGGFDAVIGNPPWGQKAVEFSAEEKDYLRRHFATARGILDIFKVFCEKAISLTKNRGRWGMILPDILLLKDYPETRRFILENTAIETIAYSGMAFNQVDLDTVCVICRKTTLPSDTDHLIAIVRDLTPSRATQIRGPDIRLAQSVFWNLRDYKFNIHLDPARLSLLEKLERLPKVGDFFEAHEGIHSGNVRGKLFLESHANKHCRKLIFGRDEVGRYSLQWGGKWVNYHSGAFNKAAGQYANLGHPAYFEHPKVFVRRTGDFVMAVLDEGGYYASNNLFVLLPKKNGCAISLRALTGLLNSALLTWYFRAIQPRVGKVFAELKINQLHQFPLPPVKCHESLSRDLAPLVEKMIALAARMHETTSDSQRATPANVRSATQQAINEVTFAAYGLSVDQQSLVNTSEAEQTNNEASR